MRDRDVVLCKFLYVVLIVIIIVLATSFIVLAQISSVNVDKPITEATAGTEETEICVVYMTEIKESIETVETIKETVVETTEELKEYTYYDCPLDYEMQDYIFKKCKEFSIDPSIIIAVIDAESNFNPSEISFTNDYGLMQINRSVHNYYREYCGIDDYLDPYQNVCVGITILGEYLEKYGDLSMALVAYNCGDAIANDSFFQQGYYSSGYSRKVIELAEDYSENHIITIIK